MSENSKKPAAVSAEQKVLCGNLSFAGAEAYKRLRANIQLSFPAGQKCCVIGMTSSNRGEGKSTTAINLAYTFAETGKKTLLVEGDMRLPNLAARLGLAETPGLSNLLVNMAKQEEVLQHSSVQENLHVITSGDIPPNPSELLGSERMKACLRELSESYDYIVLDLPPVNLVADALEVARVVDGFVFVVRQEYSSRKAVSQAIKQLEVVDAKILGFVWNYTASSSKNERYYRDYRSYAAKKEMPLSAEKKDG